MNRRLILLTAHALLLTACTSAARSPAGTAAAPRPAGQTPAPNAGEGSLPGNLDQPAFFDDDEAYDIRQILPRDGIRPIYEPEFVASEDAGLDEDELVMGVVINGDARAYPVGILRGREMVNDTVGGTPVLVTW